MAARNDPQRDGRREGLQAPTQEPSVLGTALTTRQIEAFGRKVTSTASTLIGDPTSNQVYQNAMNELHKELRRPGLQRSVFSYAKASPTEIVRSKLSSKEIKHRAVSSLPDELLADIPEDENDYSLFQGFQATLPEEDETEHRKRHRRHHRGQKLLDHGEAANEASSATKTRREQARLTHRLEMMAIRKNMCSSEIHEIDHKVANLHRMRKIILERLEDLEQQEVQMEQDLVEIDSRLVGELENGAILSQSGEQSVLSGKEADRESVDAEQSFMSASIYGKMPSPKPKRHPPSRRKSAPVRHEHFDSGSLISEFKAHSDVITAIDFDEPFGTMVSAGLDDTVRVWDLNLSHCIGYLEGHHASVRCLQVDENIVATGSMDASIKLWDLNQIDYTPRANRPQQELLVQNDNEEADDLDAQSQPKEGVSLPAAGLHSSTADCFVHTLSAHVAEVTALHLHGNTLVSGSADKTLRQWDLVKGRCVQTLDVLWAAAQASASINPANSTASKNPSNISGSSANRSLPASAWTNAGSRVADPSADFVGALQCFDAALACGTADAMVRLWDLRTGQVHRSLVGHTGAITCLQFDERVLVTGSADRSIRIWDLRTGGIRDVYAYDNPVTSMMFDARRIAAADGETVAKIYDKSDGRHWGCGGSGTGDPNEGESMTERIRLRDGYLVEGRGDGFIGIWSC